MTKRIYDNGTYRDMTAAEVAELEAGIEAAAQRNAGPTVAELKAEIAELRAALELLLSGSTDDTEAGT